MKRTRKKVVGGLVSSLCAPHLPFFSYFSLFISFMRIFLLASASSIYLLLSLCVFPLFAFPLCVSLLCLAPLSLSYIYLSFVYLLSVCVSFLSVFSLLSFCSLSISIDSSFTLVFLLYISCSIYFFGQFLLFSSFHSVFIFSVSPSCMSLFCLSLLC